MGKSSTSFDLRGLDGFQHVMAARIVFAVAEDDQRFARAIGRGEALIDRIIDGVVEGRAQNAALARREFQQTTAAFFEVVESVDDVPGHVREILRQADVVAEADQKYAIARGERFLEKCIEVFVMRLDELGLAAAEIDYEPEVERHIGAVGEERRSSAGRRLRRLRNLLACRLGTRWPEVSRTEKPTLTR